MNAKLQYKHELCPWLKLKSLCLRFALFILVSLSAVSNAWPAAQSTQDTSLTFIQLDNHASTNATSIQSITYSFFNSTDCSGTGQGTKSGSFPNPSFTTDADLPLSLETEFTIPYLDLWEIGNTELGISATAMSGIKSIAVTFRSTTANTPQTNFSGSSFACIPISCTNGKCNLTSDDNIYVFILATTAKVGDPADGGIIASIGNGNNLIAASDESPNIKWWNFSYYPTTDASSLTDGADNTNKIMQVHAEPPPYQQKPPPPPAYAAWICNTYGSKGGYTGGWFLPAIDQLSAIVINLSLSGETYWSSTENDETSALSYKLGSGSKIYLKYFSLNVRCARTFVP